MNVVVLMACYNRIAKTKACIETIGSIEGYSWSFIVADGGSTDGTVEYLLKRQDVCVITDDTTELFYSNGMRRAMLKLNEDMASYNPEVVLLVNDDVGFDKEALVAAIDKAVTKGIVVAGCTEDGYGYCTYGGVRRVSRLRPKTELVSCRDNNKVCDTCNGNCMILPVDIYNSVGVMDEKYIHSLGDYDYGFAIARKGYTIESSDDYIGVCVNDHVRDNTWLDNKLSIKRRLALKERALGQPVRQWFHYLRKNYSLATACAYVANDYVKIVLHR